MGRVDQLEIEVASLRRRVGVLTDELRGGQPVPLHWRIPPRRRQILETLLKRETVATVALEAMFDVTRDCVKNHMMLLRRDLEPYDVAIDSDIGHYWLTPSAKQKIAEAAK